MALAAPKTEALTFNFTTSGFANPTVAGSYLAAAQQAGALWSGLFKDNITVNVTLANASLAIGTVSNTTLTPLNLSYTSVRAALVADATSVDDASATSNLQSGSSAVFGINRGSSGGPGWRLDNGLLSTANNQTVQVTRADAKAIGLVPANDGTTDFTVNLSTSLVNGGTYDLDRSDGIGSLQYDLVGVIAHELGHGMGMQSMAEVLSATGNLISEANMIPRVADLFRFSSQSVTAAAGAFDLAANTNPKYFSLDGGATAIANFALGSSSTASGFGNGQEANHWLATTGQPKIGIMDPVIGLGQLLTITPVDTRFFDAI